MQKRAQTYEVAKTRHVSANICNWLINNKILCIIKYSKCKAYSSEANKQTNVCVRTPTHVQVPQKYTSTHIERQWAMRVAVQNASKANAGYSA